MLKTIEGIENCVMTETARIMWVLPDIIIKMFNNILTAVSWHHAAAPVAMEGSEFSS